jgi:hypothetical protein
MGERWVHGEVAPDLWKQVKLRMVERGLTWNQMLAEAIALWVRQDRKAA